MGPDFQDLLGEKPDMEIVSRRDRVLSLFKKAMAAARNRDLGRGEASPDRFGLTTPIDLKALLADKAYDADRLIELLTRRQITPVIPPTASRAIKRACDFVLYCERNLVERFFNKLNKLKQYRAIATRYDKLARNFLAGVHIAASVIVLN